MSIKQEGSDDWDNSQDEFGKLIWDRYVNPNKDRWYLNTDIPKLGDARGKAILFRRFGVQDEQLKKQFGFSASSWTYNTTNDDRGQFVVQDFVKLIPLTTCQRKSITLKIWPRELKIILLMVMTKCFLISLQPLISLTNNAGHNLLLKL